MAPSLASQIVKRGLRTGDLDIMDDMIALDGLDPDTDEALALSAKIAKATSAYVAANEPPPKVPKGTSKQTLVIDAHDGSQIEVELRFTAKAEDKDGKAVNRYSLRVKDAADESGHKDAVLQFGMPGTHAQLEANEAPPVADGLTRLITALQPVKANYEDPVAYCKDGGIDIENVEALKKGAQVFEKLKGRLDKLVNIVGEPGWEALTTWVNSQAQTQDSAGE